MTILLSFFKTFKVKQHVQNHKLILHGQNTLIPKSDKKHTKVKLQADIPDEHRCKNLQQDISKPNLIQSKQD